MALTPRKWRFLGCSSDAACALYRRTSGVYRTFEYDAANVVCEPKPPKCCSQRECPVVPVGQNLPKPHRVLPPVCGSSFFNDLWSRCAKLKSRYWQQGQFNRVSIALLERGNYAQPAGRHDAVLFDIDARVRRPESVIVDRDHAKLELFPEGLAIDRVEGEVEAQRLAWRQGW